MYVVCVTVNVKPDQVESFRKATLENASATRKEPGNVRFDVSRSEDDPAKWFLYEVYRTRNDFTAHQQTPHYLKWKQTVAPWMAEPRKGVKHESVFPEDSGW